MPTGRPPIPDIDIYRSAKLLVEQHGADAAHKAALHFMHYNFVRIHQSLRVTPAMAAGVADRLWEIADIVRLVDEWELRQKDQKNAER